MTDIKLKFPEIDQTYAFLDLQTTDKGTVRQITGNIVTSILNPQYCQNQKIIDGQIFFDKFTNEIKLTLMIWLNAMRDNVGKAVL